MLTLEGEPTAPSFLKNTLKVVDLLVASPDIASIILDLTLIIDQASVDYNCRMTLNREIEEANGRVGAFWVAATELASKLNELSKEREARQKEVEEIDQSIASMKAQIKELEAKIFANEKLKEELLAVSNDVESQEELNNGLKYAEHAQALDAKIEALHQSRALYERRLELQKIKYLQIKANLPF